LLYTLSMRDNNTYPIIIVGGGASGFFAAITAAASVAPGSVALLEKNKQPLAKVRISGGGRCNVTHACFEQAKLITYYPRGKEALRSCFHQFQPKDTILWFQERGVSLKEEADGRMFPTTNSSQTIIDCLLDQAKKHHVEFYPETHVLAIEKTDSGFCVQSEQKKFYCHSLLLAAGPSKSVFAWLTSLGHTINPPVPSLFTFNIDSFCLKEASGISVKEASVSIVDTSLSETGPLLITHWGFSGPCVLRLSSWGARILHEKNYTAFCEVNWLAHVSSEALKTHFQVMRQHSPKKNISNIPPKELPQNLWKLLLMTHGVIDKKTAALSNKDILDLILLVQKDRYKIKGQTTFKEEFVTCGGVVLDEVNMKTMESKKLPGLFFAGELLDIDAVTGGFNFQNAWTTGWIAGNSMATSERACRTDPYKSEIPPNA
jgi:predicted Rossmann fold flavoprotein